MKRKTRQRLQSFVAVLLMIGCLQIDLIAPPVKAVTQAEINALKNNASDLDAEKKALQKEIDALESNLKNVKSKKALLDRQSDVIRSEIANTEEMIADYETMIAQTKAEIAETEAREERQFEVFCRCIRQMEEGGTISYWAVLFNAADFNDLLGRLDAANEVLEYRQGVIDTLRILRQSITAHKEDLEGQLAEQEAAKATLQGQKAELDKQMDEATALVREIEKDQEAKEKLFDEVEAEGRKIQQEIKRLEQELAAQLGPATVGGYIWPVSSKRITSPYGNRFHPVSKVWKMHSGVDIGGVGYTTKVVATKAGIVTISKKSSSYGNYVVVSHGTGNSTLYAHLSSRSVKVGDKVTQGQVLGITGSTGISNGPHLHYEITENGSRVDPLKYLPGYVKAW